MSHNIPFLNVDNPDGGSADEQGVTQVNSNPKRIILCMDGTWQSAMVQKNSVTNVGMIARFLSSKGSPSKIQTDVTHKSQMIIYKSGIGSVNNRFDGIHGLGLAEMVQEGYLDIMRNYNELDEIVLVGFSRGAYAARSLASMLCKEGLLNKTHPFNHVNKVFMHYNKHPDFQKLAAGEQEMFNKGRDGPGRYRSVPIMLFVFDTVGSLGLSLYAGGRRIGTKGEHDMRVLEDPEDPDKDNRCMIKVARQALALDDVRRDFTPEVWPCTDEQAKEKVPCKGKDGVLRTKQVWFPGTHSDVGGGFEADWHKTPKKTGWFRSWFGSSEPEEDPLDEKIISLESYEDREELIRTISRIQKPTPEQQAIYEKDLSLRSLRWMIVEMGQCGVKFTGPSDTELGILSPLYAKAFYSTFFLRLEEPPVIHRGETSSRVGYFLRNLGSWSRSAGINSDESLWQTVVLNGTQDGDMKFDEREKEREGFITALYGDLYNPRAKLLNQVKKQSNTEVKRFTQI